MSETPQNAPVAGWYPDPSDATRLRWWDGAQWTASQQPAPGYAQQTAPAYTAAPAYAAEPAVRRDILTNTVWIWLVVLLPLLGLVPLLFVDWAGYVPTPESLSGGSAAALDEQMRRTLDAMNGTIWISLFGLLISALTIVFAWLDWRELRRRGVDRPFHWAWIFLTLVVSNGIYVIGRGVVLRRRTGSGLVPIWVWIAVTVVGFVFGIVVAGAILSQVLDQISQLPGYGANT